MLVEDCMTTDTVTCYQDEALSSIAHKMFCGDFGAVPVLDDFDRPVAMITDRDICMTVMFKNKQPDNLYARDVTSQAIISCSPKWEVKQALKLMRKEKIRRLPVVDDDAKIVGILSLSDIASGAAFGRKKGELKQMDFIDTFKSIAEPHMRGSHQLIAQEETA